MDIFSFGTAVTWTLWKEFTPTLNQSTYTWRIPLQSSQCCLIFNRLLKHLFLSVLLLTYKVVFIIFQYLVKKSTDRVSVLCKLAMKCYLMRVCATSLCPLSVPLILGVGIRNFYYLALINRAGGLYERFLTEVTRPRSKFSHTDQLSSVNKMFIIWQKSIATDQIREFGSSQSLWDRAM